MPKFFSQRQGVRPRYDLVGLRRQFQGLYSFYEGKGYFAEHLGFRCVNGRDGREWTAGKGGPDLRSYIYGVTGRDDLYPVDPTGNLTGREPWSEDQIFDMLQFLATIVSKSMAKKFHDWSNCGDHYGDFRHQAAIDEYRSKANEILGNYGDGTGWEMGPEPDLEIRSLAPSGMEPLLTEKIEPGLDDDSVRRVELAVMKFRSRGATSDAKRDAVRDLGDVLEKYRADLKADVGSATESAMFNLLNNYDIRHNNDKQKTDYDAAYMDGLFYHQLNLIHLLARVLRKKNHQDGFAVMHSAVHF